MATSLFKRVVVFLSTPVGLIQGVKLFGNRHGSTWIRPGDIARQKTVGGSGEAASLLIGRWREPLLLTLNASMRKKASLPVIIGLISV